MYYHIMSARHVGGHKLELRFADGTSGVVDFQSYVRRGGVFRKLADLDVFTHFKINPDFGTLTWGDVDIASDSLYAQVHGSKAGEHPISAVAESAAPYKVREKKARGFGILLLALATTLACVLNAHAYDNNPVITVVAGPFGTVTPSGVVEVVSGGSAVVNIQAQDYYHIERGTNLLDNPVFGVLIRTNIPGTAPLNEEIDPSAAGAGPWFYRIKLEP